MKTNLLFNFKTDSELLCGINRLSSLLGFELGNGITVTAREASSAATTAPHTPSTPQKRGSSMMATT